MAAMAKVRTRGPPTCPAPQDRPGHRPDGPAAHPGGRPVRGLSARSTSKAADKVVFGPKTFAVGALGFTYHWLAGARPGSRGTSRRSGRSGRGRRVVRRESPSSAPTARTNRPPGYCAPGTNAEPRRSREVGERASARPPTWNVPAWTWFATLRIQPTIVGRAARPWCSCVLSNVWNAMPVACAYVDGVAHLACEAGHSVGRCFLWQDGARFLCVWTMSQTACPASSGRRPRERS